MSTQSPRDRVVQIGIGEHTPHTLARAYINDYPTIEELRFVDISEERLSAVEVTCRTLNEETGRRIKITTSQNATDVLEDATMVVFAFAVSWPQSTMDDYARADRHGIPMVEGETIGIGGGLQGIRHLNVAMPIMDRMKSVCPNAWCVVSTNPIRHLVDYATRYARLEKCIGLCHGATATLRYIEKTGGIPPETIDGIVAGANHFIWYLKLWSRQTGDDFYPELARILEDKTLDGEMSRTMFSHFGLYPGNGPTHIPDAFGFFSKETWQKYDIQRCLSDKNYDPFLDYLRKDVGAAQIKARLKSKSEGNKRWTGYMRKVRDGQMSATDFLATLIDEDKEDPNGKIIKTLFKTDTMHYNPALNVPNNGAVSNLPDDAIVEVPGVSNRTGAYPLAVGPMPSAVAELVRRQVAIGQLHVEAAATGSKQILRQSILLDPTMRNPDAALAFIEDTLAEAGNFYPTFA